MDSASLNVFLGSRLVGTIFRVHGKGDASVFQFDPSYLDDPDRPILSLGFKGRDGGIHYHPKLFNKKVHPFFANLLPEGGLRQRIAERNGVSQERDLPLLEHLGEDLPGAVVILPSYADPPSEMASASREGGAESEEMPLKFSLAGVQLKFSVIREAGGGLTIPVEGKGGNWIAKLPSERFDFVPENEFFMMDLARRSGLDIPEVELVSMRDIHGLPKGIRKDRNALIVRRFDRRPGDGSRVHIEDFAQVFQLWPARKYGKVSYGNIAQVVFHEVGGEGLEKFIARLVFNAAIGNGDMHAKNWSLIYPDGHTASLAPGYDFLSTLPYLKDRTETMGLSLAGSKRFDDVSVDAFEHLARKYRLPVDIIVRGATEAAQRVVDAWADTRDFMDLPEWVKEAIETNMKTVPITGREFGVRLRSGM